MPVPNRPRTRSKILVIDDKYALSQPGGFGREEFEAGTRSLPFVFEFTDSWDELQQSYTVRVAVAAVERIAPDGVLLDVVFGPGNDRLGLLVLAELTLRFPHIPVIMMTSLGRGEVWDEAWRLGAVDYAPKPLDATLLGQTLDRYIGVVPDRWLIGHAAAFLEAVNLASLASRGGHTPIMLTGESGTGKEIFAAFIGRHGMRANRSFEVVFLPGVPQDLQAASLFGFKKGAYTGADRDEPGRFRQADGGIVFLDEIADIAMDTQVKLLRVADCGEVVRLGDGSISIVDVQIVSATNADLAKRIKDGTFRYDLWARLNGMPVVLPTLAQRIDDIPMLILHLMRCESIRRKRPIYLFPGVAELPVREAFWHGNIRGLKAFVQRIFDRCGQETPCEEDFLAELPQETRVESTKPQDIKLIGAAGEVDRTSAIGPNTIQTLRLRELALLHQCLILTRDLVTGEPSRAKAAAILKGKARCSTNEFDRWVQAVWKDLSEENRRFACRKFPELISGTLPNAAIEQKEHP